MSIAKIGFYIFILMCVVTMSGCKNNKAELQAVRKEAEDTKDELITLQYQMQQIKDINDRLKENIDILEEKLEGCQAADINTHNLTQELNSSEDQVATLIRQRDKAVRDQEYMAEQVEQLQEELKQKTDEFAELNSWADRAQQTIEQLQAELGIEGQTIEKYQPMQNAELEQIEEEQPDTEYTDYGQIYEEEIEDPNI